nr:aminotransferase class V-fold PLP-dependent enzyme [Treponemataceae bacterium]
IKVDVQDLDVDFLSFSGHKMLSPMGIGVLYGKKDLLEKMPPFLTGGEMIEYVTREGATYAELPHKFEAGTVNAAGGAALGQAIRYYNQIGFDKIEAREEELSRYTMEKLKAIPFLHLLGSDKAEEHHGIFTFTIEGVHPHDIAAILDADKVNIRAGHHCAQPLMKFMQTPSTARASLSFYNTEEEIDRLAASLSTLRKRMGYKD